VIDALVLGTIDGSAVRADLAEEGFSLLGVPEDISEKACTRLILRQGTIVVTAFPWPTC